MNMTGKIRFLKSFDAKLLLKHKQSAIIIGASLLVVLLAHILLVGPVIGDNAQMRSKLARQDALIAKYESKIAEAAEVSEDLQRLREQSGLARYLEAQETPAKVAASMDAMLSKLEGSSLKKVSFKPLDTTRNGSFIETNMKCALTGDVRGLYSLFKALEDYPEPVKVKECIIRALSGNRPKQLAPMTIVITISTIIGIDREG
jgi:hypothetical protein